MAKRNHHCGNGGGHILRRCALKSCAAHWGIGQPKTDRTRSNPRGIVAHTQGRRVDRGGNMQRSCIDVDHRLGQPTGTSQLDQRRAGREINQCCCRSKPSSPLRRCRPPLRSRWTPQDQHWRPRASRASTTCSRTKRARPRSAGCIAVNQHIRHIKWRHFKGSVILLTST